MSSMTRSLQRAVKRQKHANGRGNRLGYTNPNGADLKARLKRESRN